jgi:hypothetical protein
MASEKYLSMKKSVNGFSFANLGFFYGFGGGVICAVYALCLMDMDQSCDGIGSLADTLRQSRIWYFWWD